MGSGTCRGPSGLDRAALGWRSAAHKSHSQRHTLNSATSRQPIMVGAQQAFVATNRALPAHDARQAWIRAGGCMAAQCGACRGDRGPARRRTRLQTIMAMHPADSGVPACTLQNGALRTSTNATAATSGRQPASGALPAACPACRGRPHTGCGTGTGSAPALTSPAPHASRGGHRPCQPAAAVDPLLTLAGTDPAALQVRGARTCCCHWQRCARAPSACDPSKTHHRPASGARPPRPPPPPSLPHPCP